MSTFEKLVGEIKQFPSDDKKRLMEILQGEVAITPTVPPQRSEATKLPFSQAVDFDALAGLFSSSVALQRYWD